MKTNKITIGILLAIIALTLIVYAFAPGIVILHIPVWKVIIGVFILYYIIKKIVTPKALASRFNIFFPLALLLVIFEKEIGTYTGIGENFVNNIVILAGGLLLGIAYGMIFKSKKGETTFISNQTYYYDVSSKDKMFVKCKMGNVEVHIENSELLDSKTVYLNLECSMGNITVYAPPEIFVENKLYCKLGSAECRPNTCTDGIRLVITGECSMGNIEII